MQIDDNLSKEYVENYQNEKNLNKKNIIATKIINDLDPIISSISKRYSRVYFCTYDDAYQAGRIGVLKALKKWDKNKANTAKWTSYASGWITTTINRYCIKECYGPITVATDSRIRKTFNHHSWDDLYEDDSANKQGDVLSAKFGHFTQPDLDKLLNLDYLEKTINQSNLSDKEKDVLLSFYREEGIRNIGKRYKVTPQAISLTRIKALKSLQKMFEDESSLDL